MQLPSKEDNEVLRSLKEIETENTDIKAMKIILKKRGHLHARTEWCLNKLLCAVAPLIIISELVLPLYLNHDIARIATIVFLCIFIIAIIILLLHKTDYASCLNFHKNKIYYSGDFARKKGGVLKTEWRYVAMFFLYHEIGHLKNKHRYAMEYVVLSFLVILLGVFLYFFLRFPSLDTLVIGLIMLLLFIPCSFKGMQQIIKEEETKADLFAVNRLKSHLTKKQPPTENFKQDPELNNFLEKKQDYNDKFQNLSVDNKHIVLAATRCFTKPKGGLFSEDSSHPSGEVRIECIIDYICEAEEVWNGSPLE